jgi:hypothetical protein
VGHNAVAADAAYLPDTAALLGARLAALHRSAATPEAKSAVLLEYPLRLVRLYEVLGGVKEVVLPAPVKAMLACQLVASWADSEAERLVLAQGVGLVSPSDMSAEDASFWSGLASATSVLGAKDKIALLADVVPVLASSERLRALALPALVRDLVNALRAAAAAAVASPPELTDKEYVTAATDLAVSDYLRDKVRDPKTSAARVVAYAQRLRKEEVERLTKGAMSLWGG